MRLAAASPLRVEPLERLDPLQHKWTELGERTGNLFATWDWHVTWWEHMGGGRPLLGATLLNKAGALVGLLPAYIARRVGPARLVRLVGNGQGDRLGPICLPADREQVAATLRVVLRSPPWREALLLAEQLPADEGWATLLDGRTIVREGSPLLEIGTRDWDEFLAGRSSSLRKQVRYQERRLSREHQLRYRLVERYDELPGALDALFALHGARWGQAATPAFRRAQAFHRAFAARALGRGWLRLWLLELDGRVAAAWYGFRFGGADWHYQSGRDPRWDRLSVGAVLLVHTIRDCVESGQARYLFLRGAESYKRRFATADPGLETLAVGSGGLGKAALVALDGVQRLPPGGRRRLARVLSR